MFKVTRRANQGEPGDPEGKKGERMNRANPTADYFRSDAWNKIRTDYLNDHELCEVCLKKKNMILAIDVFCDLPIREMINQDITPDHLIAVCARHRKEIHKMKRKGLPIRSGREEE